jgi:hypothetical protein
MTMMTNAHPLRQPFRSRWWGFLNTICETRLPIDQIQEILDFLLYDGEDVPKSSIFGVPRHTDNLTPSPVPTPIERLFIFTGLALGRLQDALAVDRSASRRDYRSKFPQHRSRHTNLLRLIHLAQSGNRPRAFSRVDGLRLFAQWSNLKYTCAALSPKEKTRRIGRITSRRELRTIERRLARLGASTPEIESIRCMCDYRRSVYANRDRDAVRDAEAAEYLKHVLSTERNHIPVGLVFHAVREHYRLNERHRRRLLRECRFRLAAAFALLPKERSLDRIGVCYFLADDSLLNGAPSLAVHFLDAAARLVASAPDLTTIDRIRGHIDWLRKRLAGRLELATRVKSADNSEPLELLVDEIGQVFARSVTDAYELVCRSQTSSDPLELQLYHSACRSWLGRLMDNNDPSVRADSFLSASTMALERYRARPKVLAVIRCGYVARLLAAQGDDEIDASFEEYDHLMGVTVLACDWQTLVDQLKSGRHDFLAKLGFELESTRLRELAAYFEHLFGVTATAEETRLSGSPVDRVLFGAHAAASNMRYTVDHIQRRWNNGKALPEASDITVGQWAMSYASPTRRPEFKPDAKDPLVALFFNDCQRIVDVANQLDALDHLDEIPILTGMAWAAYHFSRTLRKVQQGGDKILTARSMADPDWLAKGIEWADQSVRLAAGLGRAAARYRALYVRKQLEEMRNKKKDLAVIAALVDEMLTLDVKRLDKTKLPSRRNRAVVKTERSLSAEMTEDWCRSFNAPVPLSSSPAMMRRFALSQRLKSFNYGLLVQERGGSDEADPSRAAVADQIVDWAATPDVFDRTDLTSVEAMDPAATSALCDHLRHHNAAVLDFLTNPGTGSLDWKQAMRNRWGTVCFVMSAGGSGLQIRPFYLHLPEALIREAIEGAPDLDGGEAEGGLRHDLVNWPDKPDGALPDILQELSDRLYPDYFLRAIRGYRRLYLCPHRHLFQVPLHAFPLGTPLFRAGFDVSYGLKTAHLASLVYPERLRRGSRNDRFVLVDTAALQGSARYLDRWVNGRNSWGRAGLGIEEIMRHGAAADQTIVCCHGQLDEARPGRARFRLWGGGRLIGDDFHRLGGRPNSKRAASVDLTGSDWVIAACDAGGARVSLRTAPGLALSLVTCGAERVTSCLYRLKPPIATRFLSRYLSATDRGSDAAFTVAVRGVYNNRTGGRAAWAEAASFTSYGLFKRVGI